MLKIHRRLGTYSKINYIFLTDFNRQKFDKLIDINGSNVFVKPNFVKNTIEVEAKSEVEKTFVFASRLEESKGIKYLLKQWLNLPKDYELHIYGDGPLEDYVKKEIKNIPNIKYLGFQKQGVIFEDMKNSMAMIFPSLWYEGYPMIIAESMAIGCPVLSSNLGNEGDIVSTSKGGVTFNPEMKNDFVNAIDEIVKNNKELRKNALLYYKDFLSKEKNYTIQNNIYEKIIEQCNN